MGEQRTPDNAGKRILPTTQPRSYDAITPTPRLVPPIYVAASDPHVAFTPTHFVSEKSLLTAYLLCFPLGFLGLHHFYLGRPAFGVLYILTLGVGGLGWLVDFFRMPCLVREANRRQSYTSAELQRVSVIDAYLMWLPFGIFGLHQYYLRRRLWGLAYTFTLGMFGVGWIIDGFRIPFLVHEIESRRRSELDRGPLKATPQPLNLWDLYTFCLSPPFGIFGAHHFRMGRTFCGVYYLASCGGCGVGWMVDWFRLKWLVDRVNHPERYPLGRRQKFVDDAYIYAFPWGLLGMHHFYLERPIWGVLYFFTGGLLGLGWLFDLCRMPYLVADANLRLQYAEAHLTVAPSGVVTGPPYNTANPGLYSNATPATGTFQTPVLVGGVHNSHPAHPWGEPPTQQPPSYDSLLPASNVYSWVSVLNPDGSFIAPPAPLAPPAYDPHNEKRTN